MHHTSFNFGPPKIEDFLVLFKFRPPPDENQFFFLWSTTLDDHPLEGALFRKRRNKKIQRINA